MQITPMEKSRIEIVCNTLSSEKSRLIYARSLEDFFIWYAAEDKPPIDKALIFRYIKYLLEKQIRPEKKQYSSQTINQKMAVLRKFASLAETYNWLDSDAAASIRLIKSIPAYKRRTSEWLTVHQAQTLLYAPDRDTLIGIRDRAILGVLIGCGLLRTELIALSVEDIKPQGDGWVIDNIGGKTPRRRAISIPDWIKIRLDSWLSAANIKSGCIFRHVNRGGKLMGEQLAAQAFSKIVTKYAKKLDNENYSPRYLRRSFADLSFKNGIQIGQIQFLLGDASLETTERHLDIKQDLRHAPGDYLGVKVRILTE